jgi:hypothetical protein
MTKQRTLATSTPCGGEQVAENKRRIDGCRERLRRNRAARRIAERATPHTFETADGTAELALAPAGAEVPGEET